MHPQIISAFGMPQGMEWLFILLIALLFFGNRLPSMMRGIGGSIKEFKKGMDDGDDKSRNDRKVEAPEGAVSRDRLPPDRLPPDSLPRDGARPVEDLKHDAKH